MLSILVTSKVLPHDNTYAHTHARSGLGYEAVHKTRAKKRSPGYASLEGVLEPCRPCDHIAAIDVTCTKIIQMARPTLRHDASSEQRHCQQRFVAVCPNRRQHRTRCGGHMKCLTSVQPQFGDSAAPILSRTIGCTSCNQWNLGDLV